MIAGHVESITPDWRGDTLAADAAIDDTVLAVTETADFDEDDAASERWLVIGDSAPLQYVAVDHDAGTVTLADPLEADFEAGLPVVVWDPTVYPSGAKVVEYVATVLTDRGPVDATIPHELVPLAGVDGLVGASVTVTTDEDGEPEVSRIRGREPKADAAFMYFPATNAAKGADDPIPDDAWTTIEGWLPLASDRVTFDATTSRFTVLVEGAYDIRVGVTISAGGANNRAVRPHYWFLTTDAGVGRQVKIPADGQTTVETSQVRFMLAGTSVSFEAWQNSGGTLDIKGSNVLEGEPPLTDCSIRWIGPQ